MSTFIRIAGEPVSLEINTTMATFIRISVLSWVGRLAAFALYLMMNYLTNVWNLSTVHAAGVINIWNGITPTCAILFAFVVDDFTGDFFMLAVSSVAYCIGLGLLTISTPTFIGPCKEYKPECIGDTQKVLFYTALPLISVGMAGRTVSVEPFLDRQSDSGNEKTNKGKKENEKRDKNEKGNKNSMKNKICRKIPGSTILIVVLIAGILVVSRIKSWWLRFGIPAICSVVATILFFSGWLDYKDTDPHPQGSPLTTTFRVLVATARNFSKPIPNSIQLYNVDDNLSTSSLRCFDKAAIKLPGDQQLNRWKVCTVREVEETKIFIRMLPMWLTFIVIGIVLSIGNTYFLEQAKNMDRKLGKLKVPILILLVFYIVASEIIKSFYRLLETCTTKKYAPPIGIATSMFLSILCCIIAATVESRRLHRIRAHGLLDRPNEKIPMSIFTLIPQFMLLGAVDGIAKKSIMCFFRNQTPKSLHKYLNYFTKGVLGLGSMASVLSVYVAGKFSERNGKRNWFQYTLNMSRLDSYYWALAVVSVVNLVIYVIIAYFYSYTEPHDDDDGDVDIDIDDNVVAVAVDEVVEEDDKKPHDVVGDDKKPRDVVDDDDKKPHADDEVKTREF